MIKKESKVVKTNLSPASYKAIDAFNYTQRKNSFIIGKDPLNATGFLGKAVKQSKKTPGPIYNV